MAARDPSIAAAVATAARRQRRVADERRYSLCACRSGMIVMCNLLPCRRPSRAAFLFLEQFAQMPGHEILLRLSGRPALRLVRANRLA
jgi:hypothetical protein